MHLILFSVFGLVCVAGAVNLLLQRHPINSALSLVVVMGALAVEYLLLGAEFVAAVQVIVYAGAIMVLFVFVIMLLNLKEEELGEQRLTAWKVIGLVAVLAAFGVIAWKALGPAYPGAPVRDNAMLISGFGGVKAVGRTLYLASVLPFEITSLLLLVAVVAAVVVAKGRI
jgi:NADH-quinone oxidoreductase subunit J